MRWSGCGAVLDRTRLLRAYHAVEPLIQEGRDLSYREVLRRSLRAVAGIEGLPLDAGQDTSLADSLPDWHAFPDVPPALRELRERGVRLAILSNTDPDLLRSSLERIGVPVDLTVTAADSGSYKPAHGHWEEFFRRSGADRERCVHVAASPFHDLAPAGELGLTAVWINRTGAETDQPRAAELPDLRDLPPTIERLCLPQARRRSIQDGGRGATAPGTATSCVLSQFANLSIVGRLTAATSDGFLVGETRTGREERAER